MTKKVVSVQLNKMYLDSLFVFRDINYNISIFFKKKHAINLHCKLLRSEWLRML